MFLLRTAVGAALIAAPLAFAAPAFAHPHSTVGCSHPCKPPSSGRTTVNASAAAPKAESSNDAAEASEASAPTAPWETLTSASPWEKTFGDENGQGPWEKTFGNKDGKGPWEKATSNGPWEKVWGGKDSKGPLAGALDKIAKGITGGLTRGLKPFG